MPQEETQAPQPRKEMLALLAWLAIIVHSVGSLHELVWKIPGTMGRRYVGLSTLVAAVLAFPLFTELGGLPPGEPVLEYRLWVACTWLVILHGLLARLNMRPRPTLYIGTSWCSCLLRSQRGQTLAEMAGGIALGGVLMLFSRPFGQFWLCVTLLGGLHYGLIEMRYRRMAEEMFDPMHEARVNREHYRNWIDRWGA